MGSFKKSSWLDWFQWTPNQIRGENGNAMKAVNYTNGSTKHLITVIDTLRLYKATQNQNVPMTLPNKAQT